MAVLKIAIDATTNIPEVIQEFSGQFKSEKTILNSSIMVFWIYFVRCGSVFRKSKHKKRKQQYHSDVYYAVPKHHYHQSFQNEAYIFCHSLDGRNNISENRTIITIQKYCSINFRKKAKVFQI
jgi:anthranilate synthase component 1